MAFTTNSMPGLRPWEVPPEIAIEPGSRVKNAVRQGRLAKPLTILETTSETAKEIALSLSVPS